MQCPRCGGCAMRLEVVSEEETIEVERCLNCGSVFGEPLIDHHHALAGPPRPRSDALTPTWDPERSRLRIIERLHRHT